MLTGGLQPMTCGKCGHDQFRLFNGPVPNVMLTTECAKCQTGTVIEPTEPRLEIKWGPKGGGRHLVAGRPAKEPEGPEPDCHECDGTGRVETSCYGGAATRTKDCPVCVGEETEEEKARYEWQRGNRVDEYDFLTQTRYRPSPLQRSQLHCRELGVQRGSPGLCCL